MKAFDPPLRSLAVVAITAALYASCSLIADTTLEGKPSSGSSGMGGIAGDGGVGGNVGGGAMGGGGSGASKPCGGTCLEDETCCADTCFDLKTNAEHCGACDKTCATGEKCCLGTCAACCDSADCATADHKCIDGACILDCTAPQTQCGSECADLDINPKHCGGCDHDCLSGHPCVGGKCEPGWATMSETGAPSARQRAAATWTGSKLFVWGGQDMQGPLDDGALYDPKTDTWTPLSTVNAPTARVDAIAVLIDNQRIMVWGGGLPSDNKALGTGKLYDLVASTWLDLKEPNFARRSPIATWTGSKVIIWGGMANDSAIGDGFYYEPAMDKWTYMPPNANSPVARTGVGWVWSGQELFLFGGRPSGLGATADGFGYTPDTKTWRKLATPAILEPRFDPFVAWTGTAMLVFGGRDVATTYANAALFDPVANTWSTVSPNPLGKRSAPDRRTGWTSSANPQVLVAGGVDDADDIKANGIVYDSIVNDWGTQIPAWTSGVDHEYGVCVWTGVELVLWSGLHNTVLTPVGERYRP